MKVKRHTIHGMVVFLGFLVFSSGVSANVAWTDQTSPITHGNWADLAVSDFNRDGVTDIIAANPDNTEIYSPVTGLPVWMGASIKEGNRFSWKLSADSSPTGRTPGIPYKDPATMSAPHIWRVLNGNTGNMMSQWTIHCDDMEKVKRVIVTYGSNSYTAVVPAGVNLGDNYHTAINKWYFTYDSAPGQLNFRVRSEKYGDMENRMYLDTEYHSDRDEIILFCQSSGSPASGDAFYVEVQPTTFTVYANYHGVTDPAHPDKIWPESTRDFVYLGEYATDILQKFSLRIDPGDGNSLNIEPGEKWYFYSPGGPETNRTYKQVSTGDFNHDGQPDIAACGPDGIDVYLQDGPKLSPIGFIPGAHNAETCPGWNPQTVEIQLLPWSAPSSVIATETWTMTYDAGGRVWHISAEFSGPQPDYYIDEPWIGTYCNYIGIGSIPGTYCNGDQFTFTTFRNSWTSDLGPATTGGYSSIALGDVNLDGDLDIIACKTSGGISVYLYNSQTGQWSPGSAPSYSYSLSDLKLCDMNRDGRLDLIGCSVDTGIHVWIGQQGGGWSADYGPNNAQGYTSITVADYNKDGLIDVAATRFEKGIDVFYLRSDGTWFTRARASLPDADDENTGNGSVSAVKVSNESTKTETWKLTCITAQLDGGIFRVEGSVSGVQPQTAAVGQYYTTSSGAVGFTIFDGPVDYAVGDFFTFDTGRGPLSDAHFSDIDTGDLDNDGNEDLFAVSNSNKGVRIWRGNGVYGWTADTVIQESSSWKTIYSSQDINFDGNPDVIAGSDLLGGIHVWIGDGTDKFGWSGWSYKPIAVGSFAKVAQGDFNLDGKTDIVAANKEAGKNGIWVWEGDNLSGFTYRPGPTDVSQYYSIAVADFNLDGRPDIAAGHQSLGFDVWYSNGDWTWSDVSYSSVNSGFFFDLCAADVDLDGDPDLVAARNYTSSTTTGIMIYYNENGSFDTTNVDYFPFAVYNYWGVSVNDFNADGIPDIAATKSVGTNALQLIWQIEIGSFALHYVTNPSGYDLYYGIDSVDFNLDSIPDLIAGEDGHGLIAGFGYGGIKPECVMYYQYYDNRKIRDVASIDLTNDGTPDFVAATIGSGVLAYRCVFSAPGAANFTGMTQPAISGDYIGVTLGDFTSDGLPDIIATSEGPGSSGVDLWVSNRDFSMVSVNGTFPTSGGTFNIGADDYIYIDFNKPIDTATMTYENIQIKRDQSLIPYSLFSYNNNQSIRIDPINIERYVTYKVTIRGGSEGIRDTSGNQLDGNKDGDAQESPTDDYSFEFQTVDTVPPSIPSDIIVTPIDGGVIMQWKANNDPKLDSDLYGYWISYKVVGEEFLKEYLLPKEAFGDPPYIEINGLDNDVPYIFAVESQDFNWNYSDYPDFIEAIPRAVKPQIWFGGMWDSNLTKSQGGNMTIMAYVLDYQNDIDTVELYIQGSPTGVMLYDDGKNNDFGAGDGIFALSAYIPPGTSSIKFPFELVATDKAGNQSHPWPYLSIQEDIPNGTSSQAHQRYFAMKDLQFQLETTIQRESMQYPSPGRPQVRLAGYQSYAGQDYEWGPRHCLTALVYDPDGPDDIESVELYVIGLPTGLIFEDTGLCEDFGPGDTVYGVNLTLPGRYNAETEGGYLPPGPLMLEIKATDRSGETSDLWPYFIINP